MERTRVSAPVRGAGQALRGTTKGRAHKRDQTNGNEHQERWLYPHYRAWADDTGGKPLSSRHFTGLLRDLFENQVHLDGVKHRDDNKGSQFCGMRLRAHNDADQPCLITHHPPPVTDGTSPVTAHSRVSDGCDTCDGFVQEVYRHLPPLCPSADPRQGVDIPLGDVINDPSYPSHPSLMRVSGVTVPVPRVTKALAEDSVAVGDRMGLVVTDGMLQNEVSSQGHAMVHVPAGHRDAQCAETPTGWLLAQCARADPLAEVLPPPCAVCGGVERWEHVGVWRCVRCWPRGERRANARADVAAAAPGTIRGDPPCWTDDVKP